MKCRGPAEHGGQCDKEAAKHRDLCPGHYTQYRRGRTLTPLRRYMPGRVDPLIALREAVLEYADAEEDSDVRRAWRKILDACVGYVRTTGRKWTSFKGMVRYVL